MLSKRACSQDGGIKLWDAVTNSVINTLPKAAAFRFSKMTALECDIEVVQ